MLWVAVVSGLVGPVVLGGSPLAAGADPNEFAAITTLCEGIPDEYPSLGTPTVQVTLYNLPANASPTASGTISAEGTNTALQLSYQGPVQYGPPGAYYYLAAVPSGLQGHATLISLTWTDGVGGGGSLGSQMVGIPVCNASAAFSNRAVAIAANQAGTGYWVATPNGEIRASGEQGSLPNNPPNNQALNYGGMTNVPLNAPIVGLTPTADGEGYWLLGADGGVFSFSDAQFYGSTGSLQLDAPVVAMAATPDGGGYWFVASDGGVFAYGDAVFYGSMGGKHLNAPIVGMAVDQATGGYWLVASDGGIFSFNAPFHGSTGSLALNSPIVGMEASPDGSGYRLAASDGGVFSYNLPFAGSYAGQGPHPMVGIAGQGSTGYWLLDNCGGVYSFGSAQLYGSAIVC